MSMRSIVKDSVDQSVVIRIIDSSDGTPETGVEHNSAGIDLWYRREGATQTAIVEAALGALDAAHADGGIEHMGHGYYRLDLPDAAVATGVDGVMVGGTVTGMIVIGCYVPLIEALLTAAGIVNEWESQSQADPSGFHVNVMEWLSQACATPTANGVPEVDLTHIMGTILTEGGAGRLAAAFIKLFDVVAPLLVASDVMRGTDSSLLAANVNVSGGVVEANVEQIMDDVQSATDLKDLVDAGYDPATNKIQGVVLVDTTTANTDMVGTNNALLAANVNVAAGVVESNLKQIDGVAQSMTDLKDFVDAGYDPATNKVEGVKTVDTTTTNTDMVGTNNAALASVCTEARLAELDAGNLPTDIAAVKTDTANIETDTQDIQSRIPAALIGGKMDSDVSNMQNGVVTAAAIATDAVDADAIAADAVAEIQAGLATAANQANIEADTQDIQSRLPAALVGGRMDSDIGNIQNNAITAASINTDAIDADAIAAGAVTEIQAGLSTHSAADVDTVLTGTHGAGSWAPGAVAPTAVQNRQEMDSNSTQLAQIITDIGNLNNISVANILAGVVDGAIDVQEALTDIMSLLSLKGSTVVGNVYSFQKQDGTNKVQQTIAANSVTGVNL